MTGNNRPSYKKAAAAVGILLTTILFFAGCGDDKQSTPAPAPAYPNYPYNYGYPPGGYQNPWGTQGSGRYSGTLRVIDSNIYELFLEAYGGFCKATSNDFGAGCDRVGYLAWQCGAGYSNPCSQYAQAANVQVSLFGASQAGVASSGMVQIFAAGGYGGGYGYGYGGGGVGMVSVPLSPIQGTFYPTGNNSVLLRTHLAAGRQYGRQIEVEMKDIGSTAAVPGTAGAIGAARKLIRISVAGSVVLEGEVGSGY